MSRMRIIIAFVAACAVPIVAVGQQPGVELRIDTRVLELGEAVNVQLVCTNIASPSAPRITSPPGLNVTLLNPTPSTSSFTQIVNGRTTRRSTNTFWLRITAQSVGTHTLPAITVMANGRQYATTPVQLSVRNTQTNTSPNGDRIIWAELTVEPRSLYVTQTYTANLTFGIRKVEIGGQVYNLDMLRTVLDGQNSQLGVFNKGRAARSEQWLADSNGKRHRYEVFKVTQRVRAEEVGTTLVGPIFLKANYPTGLRRGFFGGYEVTGRRRETARVDGIVVEVKAPPLEGRPADYFGAIGRFSMAISAKPLRVEQGQPITLTVSFSGSPLEGLAGPSLTRHAELASRFDFTKDELIGDTEGSRKVFHRAIFPKRTGDQTVPSIPWSYFDPQRERYVTLSSDPIAIAVDPGSGSESGPIVTDAANSSGSGALTVLRAGIEANYTDTDAVLADQSLKLGPTWYVTLGLCPLAWLVVTVLARHRTRMNADVRFARRRRARRSAHARLSKALSIGDPESQADRLAAVVTEYLSDRFGLPTKNLTPDEVRSLPLSNGFDDQLADEIAEFIEHCDAARYAGSAGGVGSPDEAGDRIRRWIENVEGTKP